MKKLLSFIFLLFIPFIVNAEVKITSAEIVDQTKDLEVDPNPKFEGLKLNIDIKFANKGEFVKYKLVVKNDTKKDYEIEAGETFSEGDYIKYLTEYEKEDSILKAGTEREIFITVSYENEVPAEAFKDGKYTESKAVAINLSNNDEQENPDTKVGYYILATASILFVSLLLIIFNKYKLDHLMVLVIAIAVALPISIFALEKLTIEIAANIEIAEPKQTFTLAYRCFGSGEGRGVEVLEFKKDMTWQEYLNSSYYSSLNEEQKTLLYNEEYGLKTFHANANNCIPNNVFNDASNNCLINAGYTRYNLTDQIKSTSEGVYYADYCK